MTPEFVAPHLIAIDAMCPACHWPERTFDLDTRRFGCVRCPHESDERDS